ncbi:MAG: leucine-rich repeat domain-containing protein, partial [Clostridia bacterium]|nr:leucine-rich repeat domain-containing protein [Clostridia bacterium]
MSKHLPPDSLPFEKSAPPEPVIEKEAPVEAPVEKEVAQEAPVTVRRQRQSISPAVLKKAAYWVVFAAVTALWGGAFALGIVKNLTSPLGSSNATLLICLVCVLLVSLIALAYLFISGGFVKKFAESSKLSLPFAAFILTLAMSFTALISALGAVADSTRLFGAGATVYEENSCLYLVTAENEVCLYDTSLFGGEGLTVPEEVNGHKVTAIGERAFYGKTALRAIEIPDSVTEVAPTAFTGCTNLSTANVPACAVNALPKANLYAVTVTGGEIAESAFEKCETLTYAELKGVTSIGKTAFARCKSLETLNISDDISAVGERAFYGCEKLKFNEYGGADYLGNADNPYSVLVEVTDKNITAFTIRSETKTIAPLAFINCAISKINIPAGVRHIAAEAFNSRLTEITVDANNSYYRVSGNCLIEIATKTLVSGFSNSVIPADGSVTKIGNSAFANRSVSFTTLPDSITEIGDSAFDDCKSLSEFTVPENVKRIGDGAFGGCNNLNSISLPEGLEEIGSGALRY